MKEVILSIKPEYWNEIKKGKKKYEFRRKMFSRRTRLVYVYASAPICKIVGSFEVKSVKHDTPEMLWKKFKDEAGINEKDFFDYFKGVKAGFAIGIRDVQLCEPFDPNLLMPNFEPPQSYVYIPEKKEENPRTLFDFG